MVLLDIICHFICYVSGGAFAIIPVTSETVLFRVLRALPPRWAAASNISRVCLSSSASGAFAPRFMIRPAWALCIVLRLMSNCLEASRMDRRISRCLLYKARLTTSGDSLAVALVGCVTKKELLSSTSNAVRRTARLASRPRLVVLSSSPSWELMADSDCEAHM